MTKIADVLLVLGWAMAFLASGWTGPLWQMALMGFGGLALAALGAKLGGYFYK